MRQVPPCWSRLNGPHLLIWPDGEPHPTRACLPSAACPQPRPRPVQDTLPRPQGVKAVQVGLMESGGTLVLTLTPVVDLPIQHREAEA